MIIHEDAYDCDLLCLVSMASKEPWIFVLPFFMGLGGVVQGIY